ncbi:MAG: fibrinogen-like YCDxxxxGGGW domain-containing protein [Ornithinimicrobium sp.]|uniref:fibrinogen-like YCDxxxxGGGW domain-containing protein n=1 Tax=Ornithinimicrobium sp. TaxID=1977084 RepID=UPI003D9BD4F8
MLLVSLLGTVLLLAGLGPVHATQAARLAAPAAVPSAEGAGLGRDTAAASCWEIKALRPDSVDGTYWLLTPAMTGPARFWCDMTTDGGGWVRIGSGREQWTTAYEGKGRPDYLWGETPTLTRAIQLPATTVDALIDGHRVDDLSDGVRVRRAENVAGTAWQDLRFTFADRDRWVWTMGAEHRVDTWSFDGASGSGGQTRNFGSDQGLRRVNATTQSDQSFNWGFAYGTQVSGTPAPSPTCGRPQPDRAVRCRMPRSTCARGCAVQTWTSRRSPTRGPHRSRCPRCRTPVRCPTRGESAASPAAPRSRATSRCRRSSRSAT